MENNQFGGGIQFIDISNHSKNVEMFRYFLDTLYGFKHSSCLWTVYIFTNVPCIQIYYVENIKYNINNVLSVLPKSLTRICGNKTL